MRRIALTNQKGGSGKTTVAVNLAAALGEKGLCVLVVDLDPQASASSWLGIEDGGKGLLEVLTDDRALMDITRDCHSPGVEVAASSSWLTGAEKALAGEVGAELALKQAVEKVPTDRYDFVLFDCPPSLGVLSVSALAAASEAIIPVETHIMAVEGLARITRTVNVVRERLNSELTITGVLPCRVDRRTRHAQEVVEHLRERFGSRVFQTVIRENVRLAEAPSFSQPITQYARSSRGGEDFRALADELLHSGEDSHDRERT